MNTIFILAEERPRPKEVTKSNNFRSEEFSIINKSFGFFSFFSFFLLVYYITIYSSVLRARTCVNISNEIVIKTIEINKTIIVKILTENI